MSKNIHRIAYAVTQPDNQDDDARWKPAGVTFLNKKDGSETVLLDTLPLSGKLVLQVPKEKDDKGD